MAERRHKPHDCLGWAVLMTRDVSFALLGTLGVEIDGDQVVIGAPRQRVLLAHLLLEANHWLRPDVLINGIWGDAIPQHPDAALQIVVSRLRSALGRAADHLVSGPQGYRIEVGDDELDLLRARREFRRAREAVAHGDFAAAAVAADAALECWTGDALADLPGSFFQDAYRELRELRFAVYELRTRAYLRCGRHVEILSDIEAWTRLEPWRERIRAYHVLALYRAGRRVDALAVCEDLRKTLAEELDVEPSTFVQELEQRVRDQDPDLLARRAGIVAPLPAWTPTTLPFVGRGAEESRIFEALREVAAGATRMLLVEGEPGIGKSRLVLEAARRAQEIAIVLAVDSADSLRPGLHSIAGCLAETTTHLSDSELRLCLGRWPGDLAELVPSLRRRLPDLPPPIEADEETRAARLRAAVVSSLSALSQRAPVVLMLDDIHRAGPALFLLIGALLVDDHPKRVLVLATLRSAPESSRVAQLEHGLRDRNIIERIELSGLAPASVRRVLQQLGRPDAPDIAEALAASTGGHPFLLGEALRESVPADALGGGSGDVGSRVREFVLRRLAAIGDPAARVVELASVVQSDFDLGLLAAISHGTESSSAVAVDRALEAGILHNTSLGTFDFVHDLARRAIFENISDEARPSMHREIAVALAGRSGAPADIATHWRFVGTPDGDRQTVIWADRAGSAALRDLDPDSAVDWFRLAVDRETDERGRARLLVRLADAQLQSGDRGGQAALREAIEIAERLDDDDLIVAAATLWTPIWASVPTLSSAERNALLTKSVERVDDAGIRAQLTARLATELSTGKEWRRARALAEDALAQVQLGIDRALMPEICMRHFGVTGSPHNLDQRRSYMDEALTVTADARDPVQRYFVLSIAAGAAIEAAELSEAEAMLDAAFRLADAADVPVLTYNTFCTRAWLTGLAGDLVEAESIAFEAMQYGARHGIDYAVVGPGLQVAASRWQSGRFAEMIPLSRMAERDADIASSILLARALASTEATRAEGVEVLTRAASDDFTDLALGLQWASSLVAAAEAAYMLEDRRAGGLVRELLEPFCDRVAFNGSWVIAPVAFGAAAGAAAAGEKSADRWFEQSIEVARRLRAPILEARTELAWARVLECRDRESPKSASLARRAHETFAACGIDAARERSDLFSGH